MKGKSVLISTMCFVFEDEITVSPYRDKACLMIQSYLDHTPHTLHIVTNIPEYFEKKFKDTNRLIVDGCEDSLQRFDRFDYTTKLYAIERAASLSVDVIYWVDCDLYTTGWDEWSFQKLCHNKQADMWGTTSKKLIRNNYIYKTGSRRVNTIREDRLIFTNREKLSEMIEHWNNLDHWNGLLPDDTVDQPWQCTAGSDGKILGETIDMVDLKYKITGNKGPGRLFATYERVIQKDTGIILDREWKPLSEPTQIYYKGKLFTEAP